MKKTTSKRITPATDRVGVSPSQASKPSIPNPTDESHNFLRDLYTNIKKEDWRKFEQKPKTPRRKKLWLILGAFGIVAAALTVAGFLVFNKDVNFSGEDVVLSIGAPAQAASGDEMVWTITLTNNGTVALNDIEINVRQPSGWQYIKATPKSETEFGNTWKINHIAAHDHENIVITAKLIGDVGSEKRFEATASYVPANFSSTFETTASSVTKLTESSLDVTIDAPHNATRGQEVSYVITIRNTKDAIQGLHVEVTLPDGFKDPSYDPKPTSATVWEERELKKGDEWKIHISGKLDAEAGTSTELKVKVGVLDADSSFVVQRERSALILILDAAVHISLASNESTTGVAVASGGKVPVTIEYSNDSDNVIEGLSVELSVTGKDSDGKSVNLVDLAGLTANPKQGKIDGTTVKWTKDDVDAFVRLTPGEKGEITVSVPVKSNVRSEGSGTNLSIHVAAKLSIENVGQTGSQSSVEADELLFPISTELRLTTEGRYYDDNGAAIGSGPMPPEVGKETRYQISWFVTNTMNGVKDVLISAKLAEGVSFVSAEESGGNNISFDTSTRQVRWRIPKVDAKVGQTLPTLAGRFTISVMPTDAQVGNILSLLGVTSVSASDAFSGALLSQTTEQITSELPGDRFAVDKARVVRGATEGSNTNTNE